MVQYYHVQRDATCFQLVDDDVPGQVLVDYGTIVVPALAFDDTTTEYARGRFRIPEGATANSNVTFRWYFDSSAAVGGELIEWAYDCECKPSGETLAESYTNGIQSAFTIEAAGTLTVKESTVSMNPANLNWTPGAWVYDRLDSDRTETNGCGDLYFLMLDIIFIGT